MDLKLIFLVLVFLGFLSQIFFVFAFLFLLVYSLQMMVLAVNLQTCQMQVHLLLDLHKEYLYLKCINDIICYQFCYIAFFKTFFFVIIFCLVFVFLCVSFIIFSSSNRAKSLAYLFCLSCLFVLLLQQEYLFFHKKS